jgi:hypothetical protein
MNFCAVLHGRHGMDTVPLPQRSGRLGTPGAEVDRVSI